MNLQPNIPKGFLNFPKNNTTTKSEPVISDDGTGFIITWITTVYTKNNDHPDIITYQQYISNEDLKAQDEAVLSQIEALQTEHTELQTNMGMIKKIKL